MHSIIPSENIFLISSILVFTAILVSRTGTKYGVPSLLVFLLVGMLFGSDGVGLVFDNYNLVQFLSIVALCVILFTGGMETKIKEIRPVLGPGIVLSTAGVLLTVIFTGLFIFFPVQNRENRTVAVHRHVLLARRGDVVYGFRFGLQHIEELQHEAETELEADA